MKVTTHRKIRHDIHGMKYKAVLLLVIMVKFKLSTRDVVKLIENTDDHDGAFYRSFIGDMESLRRRCLISKNNRAQIKPTTVAHRFVKDLYGDSTLGLLTLELDKFFQCYQDACLTCFDLTVNVVIVYTHYSNPAVKKIDSIGLIPKDYVKITLTRLNRFNTNMVFNSVMSDFKNSGLLIGIDL